MKKLKRLELAPIYVYDEAQKQYVLCGSSIAMMVLMQSGEVFSLKEQ
ncbi:hypothetical protein ACEQPO_06205 [Bacillus sp. SL00103]